MKINLGDFESESFDEPLLEVIKSKAKKEGRHDTGGPRLTLKWKD